MTDPQSALPTFNFTIHPSTSSFNVPPEAYISNQTKKPDYTAIATGAMTFDASSPPRILLVQRAGHDSMPHRWEVPGGGCDKEDPSILFGAARELWEEAGLVAASIGPRVGADHIFGTRRGLVVSRYNFIVEPVMGEAGELNVKLDPNEHEAFVWATEEDIKSRKAGNIELNFTTREAESAILEAFTIKKEMKTTDKT
ncbi:ATP-dependent (S)-NAD(P)H-hydrate dehydratase [Venturia nashicola]|uniref:ATP-dependent (S)-NAD(P)H-hydrate dehydratase n=1 Tax=Venturia nashicola TaxID=86259 RepID=A0A4Z1NMB7_9PEZI|nr:ATP-dependent (S)-NAD(P)H-hydrate dehydratase [Venturia nashicola]TLD25755.1 ATP-dependent (S)-NAD(P)H-hydrate dehydratase [Venturia nashicola]